MTARPRNRHQAAERAFLRAVLTTLAEAVDREDRPPSLSREQAYARIAATLTQWLLGPEARLRPSDGARQDA
jgi:hypothetical protein